MECGLRCVELMRTNPEWEKVMAEKKITVTRDSVEVDGRVHNLIMLKYNLLDEPDFNDEMTRECRGLIVEDGTFDPVTVPFFKFGNYGESYCPEIDWNSASVLQKVDGSLIKIVRLGDGLLISTNGTIDACKAPVAIQAGCKFRNYGDLAISVLKERFGDDIVSPFSKGITYMFELVSPWTRVIVPWTETDLYFLGWRDNGNLEEFLPYDHRFSKRFKVPKKTNLRTLDECLSATKEMPWDDEGYVVVDMNFNRIKVKSPAYVAIHHMKGEGVLSVRNAIDLIREAKDDDYLSYFPEFSDRILVVKEEINSIIRKVDGFWNENKERILSFPTRREQAEYILTNFKEQSGVLFTLLNGKVTSAREFFMKIPTLSLMKYLGYKD